MRDFPGYKKNFSRIEYIKDTLNDFKQTYDSRINALKKAAQYVTASSTKFIEANKDFESKTGRIGTFDLKKGRVVINSSNFKMILKCTMKLFNKAMENEQT